MIGGTKLAGPGSGVEGGWVGAALGARGTRGVVIVRSQALAAVCASAMSLLGAVAARGDPAGFAFLEVPAGARASALGGAFAASAEGVEAAFWNPAGLAATRGVEITASHYEFIQHLRHAQFGVAGALFGGGLAGTLRAMYSEPITERDAAGNATGTFGAHDLEFGLAYGRPLGGGLRVGGSAQIVRERIAQLAATTWALGGGATWEPRVPRLRLALSLHNLGPHAAYTLDGIRGRPVALPAALQAGVAYALETGGLDLRGALEARATRGRAGVAMLGMELGHASGTALRGGLRLNDDAAGFSVGAGYATPALHLDYAFVPFRLELGDTHRLSLSAWF